MIAKLITHGGTRDQAIARMHDALNAFVIRGISTNLAFQSALLRHPRFVAGSIHTGFIAEEFPKGFHPSNLMHEDPILLASVAAYARRRYIHRAVQITGQLKGYERRVGSEWVVLMQGQRFHLDLNLVKGGCDISYEGQSYSLRTNWKLGEILLRGTWNGEKICIQVERMGLKYRIFHWGTQADAMVMTGRAAELLALMPDKPPPDLSKFLLSPMPGLLTEIAVKAGQEVRAGENLVVIEAMKMQNILRAEIDCVVADVMARPGDSLSVDQPIVRFQ
jgi:propionyl-CoA carboxylase alpha chain